MSARIDGAQSVVAIGYNFACLSRMVPVTMAQLESRGVRVPAFNGERGDHPCDARTPRDFCVLISGFTRPKPVRMVLGVEMKHTKPGESLHAAHTRAQIDQRLIDGIEAENQAKKSLEAAAKRFAQQVKDEALIVANWGDGQAGYAIDAVRTALIEAVVFRKTKPGPIDPRKSITARTRTEVFERDAYRCVKCRTHLRLTIDHKTPISLGGGNEVSNLQTLCMPCNAKKGAKA